MFKRLTRATIVGAVLAASAIGLSAANPAAAAPPLGANTLTPSSGTASTVFSLNPPSGSSCTGSGSGTPAYRWQTYMVSNAVDASTLTYASGPNPISGQFVSPLFDNVGTSVINKNPSASPLGLISGIPTFSFSALVGGAVTNGAYKIGFACTQAGALDAGKYWETVVTLSSVTPTGFNWAFGAVPAAPVITPATLTAGITTLDGTFTSTAATPAITGFTVSAQPLPSGAAVTLALGPTATSFSLTGLATGTSYSVTVTATNTTGTSVASNAVVGTPNFPAPVLTAASAPTAIAPTWTTPAGTAPTAYAVTVTTYSGTACTTTAAGTSPYPVGAVNTTSITLPLGTYCFSVKVAAPYVGNASNVVVATVVPNTTLIQDLSVTRPAGALVLTQRCGVYGSAGQVTDPDLGTLAILPASPANADPTPGPSQYFPTATYAIGGLPTGAAPTTGAAPYGNAPTGTNPWIPTGTLDPRFSGYPYPVDANGVPNPNYPTHCGINLGIATLITSGPKAGAYFSALGRMAQVTVINTNDLDTGWTVNGQVSTFSSGSDSFSGNLMGWNPQVTFRSLPNLDGYTMAVNAGGVRNPAATSSLTGLGAASNNGNTSLAQALAQSPANQSLGMAVLDARLRLFIPVTANAGIYTGTLTLTTA